MTQPPPYGAPNPYDQPQQYQPQAYPQQQYPQQQQYPPQQYAPQDYSSQQYPPPGDPYQYYQAPPAPPQKTGTNGFAVASLIFGILGGILLSVIFGIVALTQVKRSGQGGRGLAIAGLVLSGAWLAVIGLVVVIAIVASDDPSTAGQRPSTGSVQVDDLKVGDCVNGVRENQEFRRLPAVPCTQAHEAEVFALFSLPNGAWPGDTAVQEQAESCVDKLEAYSPSAVDDDKLDVFYLHPTRQSWARGDRTVTCLVVDFAKRTGSVKGK